MEEELAFGRFRGGISNQKEGKVCDFHFPGYRGGWLRVAVYMAEKFICAGGGTSH